jgi:hypothetical protein
MRACCSYGAMPRNVMSAARVGLLLGLGGIVVTLACSPQPTLTPAGAATVTVARTQISQIQSGAATPGSTAQALATLIAPTLQIVQQTVGPIATSVARSPVQITAVDVASDNTTVGVHNSSSAPVNLDGWTLFLGPNIAITLPPIDVAAGQSRNVHLAAGETTESDVYLGASSVGGVAMTFAPGQRAVLVAPDDQVASVFATT